MARPQCSIHPRDRKFESNSRFSRRIEKYWGFCHPRRQNKRGFVPSFVPEGGTEDKGWCDVLQANRAIRGSRFMRTSRNSVLPDGSPAAKEIVEATSSARRERAFTLGMASNGFAPKVYLHRANEPTLPDAVAPGRRHNGALVNLRFWPTRWAFGATAAVRVSHADRSLRPRLVHRVRRGTG